MVAKWWLNEMEWHVMNRWLYLFEFVLFVESISKEKCLKPSSTVKHVKMCPETQEKWESSSVIMNCSQYTSKCPDYDKQKWEYHCVIDTFETELLEVCAPSVNIIGENCAEFNIQGGIIQENTNAPCSTANEKCPFSYLSTDAYKFPGCFSLPKLKRSTSTGNYLTTLKESTSLDKRLSEDEMKSSNITKDIILGSVIVFLLLIIGIILWRTKLLGRILPCNRRTDTDEHEDRKEPETETLIGMQKTKNFMRNLSKCSSLDSSIRVTSETETRRSTDLEKHLEAAIWENGETRSSVLFVAAIDIGATYSGYGYSSIFDQFNIDKNFSITSDNVLTTKILTAVLLSTDNNEDLYGYEARKTYEESLEREKLLFFHHFHRFYEKKGEMMIKAENGMEKPLKDVLTKFIRYLLNLIIYRIKEVFNRAHDTNDNVDLEDVNVVVTYPVSWDECLIPMLRSSAHDAGISERSLFMISEVQTVLPFLEVIPKCMLPSAEGKAGRKIFKELYNKDFIILDLGGERFEITKLRGREGQERSQNIEMRYVDWDMDGPGERFISFMKSLFGEYIISDLQKNYVEDYSLLLHNFETEKHKINNSTPKIYLSVPTQLSDLVQEHNQCSVKELVEPKSIRKYSRGVTFENHKLHIDAEVFRVVIFKPALMLLSQHLKEFVEKDSNMSGISFFCMVGGYSNSKLFQDEVKRFCDLNNLPIIMPDEAELVILKGAIYAGHLHWFRCQYEEKLKTLTF